MRDILFRLGLISSPISKRDQIVKLELQVQELLSEATILEAQVDSLNTEIKKLNYRPDGAKSPKASMTVVENKAEAKPVRRRRTKKQ